MNVFKIIDHVPIFKKLWFIVAFIGAFTITFSFLPVVHAAGSDPTVVIALGTTLPASACKHTVIIHPSALQISTQTALCNRPVIQMHTAHVPLSQAKAMHEAYVVLPARNASQTTQSNTMLQIMQLANTKERALQPAQSVLRVSSSVSNCSTSSQTMTLDWSPLSNTLESAVTWNTSSDCNTVFINNDRLTGRVAANALFWNKDKYASATWWFNCNFIGTNTIFQSINSVQQSGFYYQPWVSDGSNCTIFDDYWFINISLQ